MFHLIDLEGGIYVCRPHFLLQIECVYPPKIRMLKTGFQCDGIWIGPQEVVSTLMKETPGELPSVDQEVGRH